MPVPEFGATYNAGMHDQRPECATRIEELRYVFDGPDLCLSPEPGDSDNPGIRAFDQCQRNAASPDTFTIPAAGIEVFLRQHRKPRLFLRRPHALLPRLLRPGPMVRLLQKADKRSSEPVFAIDFLTFHSKHPRRPSPDQIRRAYITKSLIDEFHGGCYLLALFSSLNPRPRILVYPSP